MTLKTEKKEIEIVLRLRKIAKLTEKFKGNNLNSLFFTALRNCNTDMLAIFIKAFAENSDGKESFGSILDTYDFIDDYMKESGKSFEDIYNDLAVEINGQGFFNKKMTEKELKETMENPIGDIDINQIVNSVAEKQVGQMVETEFRGHKA